MAKIVYFLVTFLESGLAVFGIRSPFETQPYRVVAQMGSGIELRAYGPRVVVETPSGTDEGNAFSRLFRYITGANEGERTIAMTTPVEMRGMMSGRSVAAADATMRFLLPASMADQPPPPRDPLVHIVRLPARTAMVLRFSGRLDRKNVAHQTEVLKGVLAKTGRKAQGEPYVMGYDPPFTIPFLRRNEVGVDVEP